MKIFYSTCLCLYSWQVRCKWCSFTSAQITLYFNTLLLQPWLYYLTFSFVSLDTFFNLFAAVSFWNMNHYVYLTICRSVWTLSCKHLSDMILWLNFKLNIKWVLQTFHTLTSQFIEYKYQKTGIFLVKEFSPPIQDEISFNNKQGWQHPEVAKLVEKTECRKKKKIINESKIMGGQTDILSLCSGIINSKGGKERYSKKNTKL